VRLLAVFVVVWVAVTCLACEGEPSQSTSSQQQLRLPPRTAPFPFLASLESLIAAGDYEGAVHLVRSVDVVQVRSQAAEHNFSGFLAVAEYAITLPGAPELDYDRDRDWELPGTSDVLEDPVWQRAATDFAAKYNKSVLTSQGGGA
jgi:hypothetical protein